MRLCARASPQPRRPRITSHNPPHSRSGTEKNRKPSSSFFPVPSVFSMLNFRFVLQTFAKHHLRFSRRIPQLQIKSVRPIPNHIGPHSDYRQAAPPRPFFPALHKPPARAAAAKRRTHHQACDLRARLTLQRPDFRKINPADYSARPGLCDKRYLMWKLLQAGKPFPHFLGRSRISQLRGEVRYSRGVPLFRDAHMDHRCAFRASHHVDLLTPG
jgi:hypothetical protein